ncbi:mucin-19-like isoform X2 [Sycon ciliatum]|uniref:mucin-19-like isoform X2 n=1 Tax=Sycon ciliatum TaxID=27933 RepID=UPI0031F62D54
MAEVMESMEEESLRENKPRRKPSPASFEMDTIDGFPIRSFTTGESAKAFVSQHETQRIQREEQRRREQQARIQQQQLQHYMQQQKLQQAEEERARKRMRRLEDHKYPESEFITEHGIDSMVPSPTCERSVRVKSDSDSDYEPSVAKKKRRTSHSHRSKGRIQSQHYSGSSSSDEDRPPAKLPKPMLGSVTVGPHAIRHPAPMHHTPGSMRAAVHHHAPPPLHAGPVVQMPPAHGHQTHATAAAGAATHRAGPEGYTHTSREAIEQYKRSIMVNRSQAQPKPPQVTQPSMAPTTTASGSNSNSTAAEQQAAGSQAQAGQGTKCPHCFKSLKWEYNLPRHLQCCPVKNARSGLLVPVPVPGAGAVSLEPPGGGGDMGVARPSSTDESSPVSSHTYPRANRNPGPGGAGYKVESPAPTTPGVATTTSHNTSNNNNSGGGGGGNDQGATCPHCFKSLKWEYNLRRHMQSCPVKNGKAARPPTPPGFENLSSNNAAAAAAAPGPQTGGGGGGSATGGGATLNELLALRSGEVSPASLGVGAALHVSSGSRGGPSRVHDGRHLSTSSSASAADTKPIGPLPLRGPNDFAIPHARVFDKEYPRLTMEIHWPILHVAIANRMKQHIDGGKECPFEEIHDTLPPYLPRPTFHHTPATNGIGNGAPPSSEPPSSHGSATSMPLTTVSSGQYGPAADHHGPPATAPALPSYSGVSPGGSAAASTASDSHLTTEQRRSGGTSPASCRGLTPPPPPLLKAQGDKQQPMVDSASKASGVESAGTQAASKLRERLEQPVSTLSSAPSSPGAAAMAVAGGGSDKSSSNGKPTAATATVTTTSSSTSAGSTGSSGGASRPVSTPAAAAAATATSSAATTAGVAQSNTLMSVDHKSLVLIDKKPMVGIKTPSGIQYIEVIVTQMNKVSTGKVLVRPINALSAELLEAITAKPSTPQAYAGSSAQSTKNAAAASSSGGASVSTMETCSSGSSASGSTAAPTVTTTVAGSGNSSSSKPVAGTHPVILPLAARADQVAGGNARPVAGGNSTRPVVAQQVSSVAARTSAAMTVTSAAAAADSKPSSKTASPAPSPVTARSPSASSAPISPAAAVPAPATAPSPPKSESSPTNVSATTASGNAGSSPATQSSERKTSDIADSNTAAAAGGGTADDKEGSTVAGADEPAKTGNASGGKDDSTTGGGDGIESKEKASKPHKEESGGQ